MASANMTLDILDRLKGKPPGPHLRSSPGAFLCSALITSLANRDRLQRDTHLPFREQRRTKILQP
jgi:hypothetical protein